MPTHLQVPGRGRLQFNPPRADWSQRGNYTNRKKPGTDSALARAASPAEVCSWHDLCCCPRTLLPFSFVAGEKQEGMFINKAGWGHTQGNIRFLPLLGLGRGPKIKGSSQLVRGKEQTSENTLPALAQPQGAMTGGLLNEISSIPPGQPGALTL